MKPSIQQMCGKEIEEIALFRKYELLERINKIYESDANKFIIYMTFTNVLKLNDTKNYNE